MALNLLIRTQMSAICKASDSCFTKDNSTIVSDTITATTPKGVLGGMIAAFSGGNDYTVVPGTEALMPAGLFANNAEGAAFENSPAVASGKVTVVKGLASVEVDVYETEGLSGGAYVVGQKLYASDNALLTNVASTSTVVIGVVTKIPTPSSPTLGVDMRI